MHSQSGYQKLTRTVENRGIYCGLPTYSQKGLKALVFGANGISGVAMLRVLSEDPDRWTQITALSRRPPTVMQGIGRNVKQVQLDLLEDPKNTALILKDNEVDADVVFFFAYVQPEPKNNAPLWSNAEELCQVNGEILRNCLEALQLAEIRPKRFLLQTGAKHYGVHYGATLSPVLESDSRVHLQPNFYYVQEDILFEYCKKNSVKWNVGRPSAIIGASLDPVINLAYPIAIYATVQKHKGEKLIWPGDLLSWEKECVHSTATLNSYLYEYMVLCDEAGDEALNPGDGCPFTFARLWTELAKWYGMECVPPDNNAKFQEIAFPYSPPPRGQYTFFEWAQRLENQEAWKEVTQMYKLKGTLFKEPRKLKEVFSALDFASLFGYNFTYSYTKSRKLGWYGYVDSVESYKEAIEQLASFGIVPEVQRE
ncbi:hypothetical protein BGZ60DRAFT_524471 [Tricladium varicosporioides]|nr:hypothetical protein BGZ60DRAFT_524471 [Hymenoscyphus varicosporioides]